MSSVVVSDKDNYRIELSSVRFCLRHVVTKAPYDLMRHMDIFRDGRTIRTDLRTLWALTEEEGFRDKAVIKRLRQDLQWRFGHIVGQLDSPRAPVGPFHLRDYYIQTRPSLEDVCQQAAPADNEDCIALFHRMCLTTATRATSREMCALNLLECSRSVSSAMLDIAMGTRKAEDIRPALEVELAMLECALGVVKEAYSMTEDVEAQRAVLLTSMSAQLQQRYIQDYRRSVSSAETVTSEV